jgi:hypothetical protein
MRTLGRLLDSAGAPVADGLYNMKFALYTVSTGGSSVWNETRENNGTDYRVQVTNGLFTTKLGQASALSASLFASGNLYFDITQATPATATCSTTGCATWESPMTPRHQLSTSAYAFNSETLDGLDSTAFAQLGTTNTFTSTNTIQTTSTNAFKVQNASSLAVLTANTSGNALQVGSSTTDANAILLGLDSYNNGTDPTGFNGAIYYNTSLNKFRCYQNAAWTDCIGSGSGASLSANNTWTGTNLFSVTNASALKVQNASAVNLLTVDTSGNQIVLGASDTTGVLLVLDTKTSAGDPTGVDGAMYYNSNLAKFRCYENGGWKNCVSTVFANTTIQSGDTIANSATETNFATNYSMAANSCQVGRTYQVVVRGVYGSAATAPSLRLRLKAGTTSLASTSLVATNASLTDRQWTMTADFICISTGVSGTVEAQGNVTLATTANAATVREMVNTATVTLDTTTAQTIQISAQFGTADPLNTITMRQLIIRPLDP